MCVTVASSTHSIQSKNHAWLEVGCKLLKLIEPNCSLPHQLSVQSAVPSVFGKSLCILTSVSYM